MGRFLKIIFALGVLTIFLVSIGCNGGKETTNSGSTTPLKVSLTNESGYLVKLSWDGQSDKLYTVTYNQEDQVNVSGEVHSVYYGARERGFKKGDCWTVEEKGTSKKGKVCYSGKEEMKRTPPPPSPAPLTAEVTNSGAILHWPDKSTRETGYQVLRCDGGSNCRLKNYIVVAELPPNTTEYHDPVTQACWRVVAVGEGGRSGFSNPVCVVNGEVEVGGSCTYVNVKTVEGIISDLISSGKISTDDAWALFSSLLGSGECGSEYICGLYGKAIESVYGEKFSYIQEIYKYVKAYYSDPANLPAEMSIDDPGYYSSRWWKCEKKENCGDYFSTDNILFKWFGIKIDLKDFPEYSNVVTTLGIDLQENFLLLAVMKGDILLLNGPCEIYNWSFFLQNVNTYVDPDDKVLHIVVDKFSRFDYGIALTYCPGVKYYPPYAITGFVIPKKYMDYRIELETSETAEFAECVR